MQKTSTLTTTDYFFQDDARAEVEILKDQIIVTKDKHGEKYYREYVQHHSMATTALDVKFVAAKIFLPTSCEGEYDLGNIRYKKTQDMFCGNTDKVNLFKECCNKYDMTYILMIPTLIDSVTFLPINFH